MLPNVPSLLPSVPVYRPVFDLLNDVYMRAEELAGHWRYGENHLSNLRRLGKGVPFVKLPTGAIRYRMSEVLASEMLGTSGPLTLSRVELAVAACSGVSEADRAKVIAHLQRAFGPAK